ncbi:MAG: 3-carboxyethylcatechol 2,3-dioxygenase, partial [Streptosporangiales bacterium]|nr:3-carboxyethylcatechol 2,3-dioxygenase [Streptosporangiales bacterium]
MSLAVTALSHSPLLGFADPSPELAADLEKEFDVARAFIRDYDPEVVVIFGPDHYNGFFYDLMPAYAIGTGTVRGVGDYNTSTKPFTVPTDIAEGCAKAVLAAGVDIAVSKRMSVDHGIVQPLQVLFGDVDALPVVPVFVNSVAQPLAPLSRVRALGAAAGKYLASLDRRVLLVGSGGLSHDPPVPSWDTAAPGAREPLINGRNPTPEYRAARQQRVIDGAKAFAAGTATIRDLNPEWDTAFLDILESGDLSPVDSWSTEDV